MGAFARSLKQGIGWPNPGWSPPFGSFGGSLTEIQINQDTALTVGAFHAGVRLIAEDISSLPLIVYRRLEPRGKERAPSHSAYAMLHDSPNPEMTAMIWRETMIGHLLTWGNCYSEKELNGAGVTVRLWPLRPDRMEVKRAPGTARRVYNYRMPDNSMVVLPQNRVLHVPGFGFDGLIGYSRIKAAHRTLENAIAIEEYGLRTFGTGAQPGVTILHKEQLSKEAKRNIVDSWEENHQGLTNAQRTAILDEGMTIDKIGFSPEDAQFLSSKQHSLQEVATWLRLSPHKLSDFSRATFSNIEESNIDHVVSTLRPVASRLEQQINKDILGDPSFFVEHLFDALLRGKLIERFQAYQLGIQSGHLSPDEVREMENRNPLPNGQGDIYLAPLNMSPLDMLADAVAGRTSTNGSTPVGVPR